MLFPRVFTGAIVLVALAACSTLPLATFPEFVDHHVAAEFVVAANGRLPLPSTTRTLVVRELALLPAPVREHFDGAGRWFEYPAGTPVRVECRLRAYAAPDGHVPAMHEILGGAQSIDALEGP